MISNVFDFESAVGTQRKIVRAVDLFCGAGGTSSGILLAIKAMRRQAELTAVNHWRTAINTHTLNHPSVRHLCESVENIHPMEAVRSRYLDILAASCECRYHSNARGGGPCNEQSRSQAWQLIRWLTDIHVETLMMENVREFLNWGPLHPITHRPIKSRKGEFFRAFLNALDSLNYSVEYKMQVAADFGDGTSRERFMLIAQRNRGKIVWPEPSHGPGRAQPWKSARSCIDWSIQGISMFDRKRHGRPDLCFNTVERIKAGLIKFGGKNAEPFLVLLNGGSASHLKASAKSLDLPAPTIAGESSHLMICEPFMVQTDQTGSNGNCVRSLERPAPTIVSKQNMLYVKPMVMKFYGTGICKPLGEHPLDTITTKPRFLLVEFEGPSGMETLAFDIKTRLFTPKELAACHSFDPSYTFEGTVEDQTKQIGNSVPVKLAEAHARAALYRYDSN